MSEEEHLRELIKVRDQEVARARSQRNRLMSATQEFGMRIARDPEGMSGEFRAAHSHIVEVHDQIVDEMDQDSFPKFVYVDGEEYEAAINALQTLDFYADPHTYFAIAFLPDPPTGDFMDDFSDTELRAKPGKRAREAQDILTKVFEGKREWPRKSGLSGTAPAAPSSAGS